MFSITICFGPQATVWNLLYKEEEKAKALYNEYVSSKIAGAEGGAIIASDDFGQTLALDFGLINGVLFEDLDQSQMAQVERGLHNARTQAKAQTRALADPSLTASMRAQGPAVHSPFPNGRMS